MATKKEFDLLSNDEEFKKEFQKTLNNTKQKGKFNPISFVFSHKRKLVALVVLLIILGIYQLCQTVSSIIYLF